MQATIWLVCGSLLMGCLELPKCNQQRFLKMLGRVMLVDVKGQSKQILHHHIYVWWACWMVLL